MPKVGGKHYSYSKKGVAAAKAEAKASGKPLEYKGANKRRYPKKRGQAFTPADSLVSFTLR